MEQALTYSIPEGEMHCIVTDHTPHFSNSDLFALVSRNNPNRQYLFLSKILCRHVPARPSVLRLACRALADRLPLSRYPTLFVGFAETATALGAIVWQEANLPDARYVCTTRHSFDRPVLATTTEAHSHAPNHILYEPDFDLSGTWNLVFVDDEFTTARTANTLYDQLAQKLSVASVCFVSLLDWSCGEHHIALSSGTFHFAGNALLHPFPAQPSSEQDIRTPPVGQWGRVGFVPHDIPCDLDFKRNESILCIGSGEYAYDAFAAAELAERSGANALCCASTRSPIRIGDYVTSVLQFRNEFGLPYYEYLYNVRPDDYTRILFFSETGHVDPSLRKALNNKVEICHP